MTKNEIIFKPALTSEHYKELVDFCNLLTNRILELDGDAKYFFLKEQSSSVYDSHKGSRFHSFSDLIFCKSLLLDLLMQDWVLDLQNDQIRLYSDDSSTDLSLSDMKAKTRSRHLFARNSQLSETSVSQFIKKMERTTLTSMGWHSIFSVMRDGEELHDQIVALRKCSPEEIDFLLSGVIEPYIEIVESGRNCELTGLNLADIWRYFRHTWVNEYKSLPGRSISILIRDAAARNHPVIGIAALGSSIAQQSSRDQWIGWDGHTFLKQLISSPSSKNGKWLLKKMNELLNDVYLKDLFSEGIISIQKLVQPTTELIIQLRELSILYKQKHIENSHTAKFGTSNELTWEERAQTFLFKSKRLSLLAELLQIKKTFFDLGFTSGSGAQLKECLTKSEFKEAVEKLVRKVKAVHVGINMMDIIVCGAVAPYNHLLGGKLVCMLLTSPEINLAYNQKYLSAVSLIASSMRGSAIVKSSDLVLLNTTSLYGIGSSQYNRISIPLGRLGLRKEGIIRYEKLGVSEGYGSFHFSANTIKLGSIVAGRYSGNKRVNSIFGEGANPLIRKLKEAMNHLQLESNPILNHRSKRIVYGIPLAKNFREVLLGFEDKAEYILPQKNPRKVTQLISKYWAERWLAMRIKNDEVLRQIKSHTLAHPITHGARVDLPKEDNFSIFMEEGDE